LGSKLGFREVIGVIHLPRLPSSKARIEDFDINVLINKVVREATLLDELGYTGVIVENYGDNPYPKRTRDPLTLSVLSLVVREVVKSVSIPVGINVLRNSGLEAYSIAVATGAKFIRVNALIETIITDSGLIEAEAPRLRNIRYNYPGVKIYADIFVKHGVSLNLTYSSILANLTNIMYINKLDYIRGIVRDYIERGGADALVVTGLATGEPPSKDYVNLIKKYSTIPVIVGSGVNPSNVSSYLEVADGIIIGSWIKVNGVAGNPIDPDRAKFFINKVRECGYLIEK